MWRNWKKMRISIIGPATQIPPVGWGAVESLIWDMRNTLIKFDHEVDIINISNPNEIIRRINTFRPDFVHINYDDWIPLYSYIQYPCAITTHFAYINQPELMGQYKQRVFDLFTQIKPNIFGLSDNINEVYNFKCGIPGDKLYLNPNGVDGDLFRKIDNPSEGDSSIYLAKIDNRKRQYLFQNIKSLYYAGNISDTRFNQSKNYLGEWSKKHLYRNLTEYGNLVLLSDGEAHPLVCLEAFAAGLGVVVSEWATANIDTDKQFITVIPESKISDIEYVEQQIIKNRQYSVKNRKEIFEYSKRFYWENIIQKYYIPNILGVINGEK